MHRLVPCGIWGILLLLSCQNPSSETFSGQDTDSLISKIKRDIQPFISQINYESAFRYLDSIRPMVEQTGQVSVISAWYRFKGSVFLYNEQYDSAYTNLSRSHRIAQNIKGPNKYIIAVKQALMNAFARNQQYDSALKYGLEAYQLIPRMDTGMLADICETLSEVYIRIGDTSSTRKYLFEGYKYASNPTTKLALANNITQYYYITNRMDSAITFHKKVLQQFKLYKDNYYYQSVNLENMGVMLTDNGHLDEGLLHLKEATQLRRQYNLPPNELTYLNIAENYFRRNDFSKSKLFVDTALQVARSKQKYLNISNAFRELADINLAQKKFEEAYSALDSSYTYHSKNDSSSFVEKGQEMENRYAAKAKDKQISNLAFENNVNVKIKNQQRIIIISMLMSILLLTIVGVLLWRRKRLQLALQDLIHRQQVLRSQMDPHFISNALSVLQGLIRSDQKEMSIGYINKFDRLVRLSLENAHESHVLLKDEIAALESYLRLQVMQFEHAFDYQITIYEGYQDDDIKIPPMLIQPFVENAVMHGISHLNYKGIISIKIERRNHYLHCIIEDNGSGLNELESGQRRRSLATIITKERLAILGRQTGKPATLSIKDKKEENQGYGIRVMLDIPFGASILPVQPIYIPLYQYIVKGVRRLFKNIAGRQLKRIK